MSRASLYAIALIPLLCGSAYAKPSTVAQMKKVDLGGVHVMCGVKASEKDDEIDLADIAGKEDMKVTAFSPEDGQKIIDGLNAAEPVTTMKAERVIAYVGEVHTVLVVVNAGRFCLLSSAIPTKLFQALEDSVFGSGS